MAIPLSWRLKKLLSSNSFSAEDQETIRHWLITNKGIVVTVGYTKDTAKHAKKGLFIGLVKEGNARLIASGLPKTTYMAALEEGLFLGLQKSGFTEGGKLIDLHKRL